MSRTGSDRINGDRIGDRISDQWVSYNPKEYLPFIRIGESQPIDPITIDPITSFPGHPSRNFEPIGDSYPHLTVEEKLPP